GGGTLTFIGATDRLTLSLSGTGWQPAHVRSTSIGDAGGAIGPIQSIRLHATEGLFDDINVQVAAGAGNTPPTAVDDTASATAGWTMPRSPWRSERHRGDRWASMKVTSLASTPSCWNAMPMPTG